MIGRLSDIIFDVPDVARMSEFYHALTGWPVTSLDDDWASLTVPDGRKVSLQAAPDHVPPAWPDPDHPAQLHLDLLTHDIEAAADRAVGLGATRLGGVDTGGSRWVTLADPAGHPVDLCYRNGAGDGVAAPMELYGVCIDTDDIKTLSRFYGELLGLPLAYESDDAAMIKGETDAVYFQQIARYVPPQWPDPAHPQQGHLDVQVDDIDAAEQRVLVIGATRLRGGNDGFRVYADPAGHPFCLIFDE